MVDASNAMLKVYVVAIMVPHAPITGQSFGRNDLIVKFLQGARRLNPPLSLTVPPWDLSAVLRVLRDPPSRPLLMAELHPLTLKSDLQSVLSWIQ